METSLKLLDHPGQYVLKNIIPQEMTIKEAAERLGIGRSTLSRFLNGKSTLSAQLALRLEKAFGADQKQLLNMQTTYNLQRPVRARRQSL